MIGWLNDTWINMPPYMYIRNSSFSQIFFLSGTTHTPSPSREHGYARADCAYSTRGPSGGTADGSTPVLCNAACQTDLTAVDLCQQEQQMRDMQDRLRKLEDVQSTTRKNFIEHLTSSDQNVRFYTGMPSIAMLMGMFNLVIGACSDITYWKGTITTPRQRPSGDFRRILSHSEEYVMTLLRIRLGLDHKVLGFLFGIHQASVSRIFLTWTNVLHTTFRHFIHWPKKTTVVSKMPRQFRERYPNTRVIIDCTEFETSRPKNTQNQARTYSQYKARNTCKALVGINPNGAFIFVSRVWSGNISDRQITIRSGFLDKIEEGDEVMADRGFTIRDLLLQRNARLNIPPFTRACAQRGKGRKLTPREIRKTREIATLRIHVERAIRRLKTFKLLSGVIDPALRHNLDAVLVIAAVISNLQGPLIRDRWAFH